MAVKDAQTGQKPRHGPEKPLIGADYRPVSTPKSSTPNIRPLQCWFLEKLHTWIEPAAASREGAGFRLAVHGEQVPEAPAWPG